MIELIFTGAYAFVAGYQYREMIAGERFVWWGYTLFVPLALLWPVLFLGDYVIEAIERWRAYAFARRQGRFSGWRTWRLAHAALSVAWPLVDVCRRWKRRGLPKRAKSLNVTVSVSLEDSNG